MIWKACLVLCLALNVLSRRRPAISEQTIKRFYGHHGDLSHVGHHEPEHYEVYAWAYPSYEFSYYVNDPHTHDQKGQHEVRDGDKVTGNYWLIQPDGRKRTVKYRSNHKSGFNAEVNYLPHHGHHNYEVKEHHEEHEHKEKHKEVGCLHCKEGRDERHGGERRDDKRDDHDKIHHDEHHGHVDKHHSELGRERIEGKDEGRDSGRNEMRDDKREDHRDGKHDGNHDERHKGASDGRRSGDDWHHGHDEERGHDELNRKLEKIALKGENKHEGKQNENQDHHHNDQHHHHDHDYGNRGHEGRLWGIHRKGKEHNDHKDHHHEARKLESRKGHAHKEHWKHGRLVGWTEGRGREDHHGGDDRRGRETNRDHDERRDQRSFNARNQKFKPLVPYGYRLP